MYCLICIRRDHVRQVFLKQVVIKGFISYETYRWSSNYLLSMKKSTRQIFIEGFIPYKSQRWFSDCLSTKQSTISNRLNLERIPSTSNITSDQLQLQELKNIIDELLNKIEKMLIKKSFKYPFESLNEVTNISKLMDKFKDNLYNEFENYLNKDNKIFNENNNNNLTIIDYINPRICNITQIINLINLNHFPLNLIKFYNLKNKTEFLNLILVKLLYKEDIKLMITNIKSENSLIDLSNPAAWFPEARKMKRKFIMHVGPTNSGKTYNSLKQLANSKSGYYAGPLRLLAREIYEKFNRQGVRCNLITGEEVIPSIDKFGKISDISSGTVEMIPLHKKMDLCIIDEIQMISDDRRGCAWTNAILGVQAKEIHLCGEESAISLIKKLTKTTGDELEIKKYKRLGKLTVLDKSLNSFKNLKEGDCVIAFSKRKILELKCEIESITKFKVGVIYGALPPEIRSKEASGFNNGEYDILIASDAVGMGLNLKIKRIIFYTIKKFNGNETIPLTAPITKQIAGRAGRFSKDSGELEGFVTTFNNKDLKFVKDMMKVPNENLIKACIWPTNKIWTHYMTKFPKRTSFYNILKTFEVETKDYIINNYFITELDEKYEILRLFTKNNLFKKTTIEDQLILSLAPINIKLSSPLIIKTVFKLFENITNCETKNIFNFNFLHINILKSYPKLSNSIEETVETLQSLEENHKLVLMFLWLSQRWPTLFVDKESANDIKTLIEKRISEELLNLRRLNKSSNGFKADFNLNNS